MMMMLMMMMAMIVHLINNDNSRNAADNDDKSRFQPHGELGKTVQVLALLSSLTHAGLQLSKQQHHHNHAD